MLRGEGTALTPGLWAFVDGNHLGGVGVVIVRKTDEEQESIVEQGGYTVVEVLAGAGIPSSRRRKRSTTRSAACATCSPSSPGLYLALTLVPEGSSVTIVHDYEGIGAWMEGRWKARDPIVAAVIGAGRALIERRRLTVTFRHQRGHQSAWAGRDDFAHYNAKADALATEAGDRFW